MLQANKLFANKPALDRTSRAPRASYQLTIFHHMEDNRSDHPLNTVYC